MAFSLVHTFNALQEHSSDPVWLWSMMLSKGLRWDNVWDVYTGGTNRSGQGRDKRGENLRRVPGVDLLLSLPDSPTNVVELFERLALLEKTYPPGLGSYDRLDTLEAGKHLLAQAKPFVQCTWAQVKTVLDRTKEAPSDFERGMLDVFLKNYISDKPATEAKVLDYMMQTQHTFVGTYAYVRTVREATDHTNQLLVRLWDTMRLQQWKNPVDTVDFLTSFTWCKTSALKPDETLDFVERHPGLADRLDAQIVEGVKRAVSADDYFARADALLMERADARVRLHAAAQQPMTPDKLQCMAQGRVELRQVFSMYGQMEPAERDSSLAQTAFARLLGKVSLYMNEETKKSLSTVLEQSPTGSLARVFAMHACVEGLDANGMGVSEARFYKSAFKHDARSKAGHAAILRKHLPDFKDWFLLVQGLGLSKEDIWHQGLEKMANPAGMEPSIAVDGALFDGSAP